MSRDKQITSETAVSTQPPAAGPEGEEVPLAPPATAHRLQIGPDEFVMVEAGGNPPKPYVKVTVEG